MLKSISSRNYKFVLALVFLSLSFIFGMFIFMFLENHTFSESLYMVAITVSTVGYGSLREFSEQGKVAIAIYIFYNLGVFAFIVSIITKYFFEGELNQIYKYVMEVQRIKKLTKHVIIVGFGRNGSRASLELENQNIEFVIIDEADKHKHGDFDLVHSSYHYLQGDATADETLLQAGLKKASAIIITLPHDADNVFIALTARDYNPNITIITRASDPASEGKLKRAGANHVVMPDALGGIHMARLIAKPIVVKFLELLSGSEQNVELDEFSYDDFNFAYRKKPLKDLNIRKRTGVTILGIKGKHRAFRFNPNPKEIIDKDDTIIILGSPENIKIFYQKFSH